MDKFDANDPAPGEPEPELLTDEQKIDKAVEYLAEARKIVAANSGGGKDLRAIAVLSMAAILAHAEALAAQATGNGSPGLFDEAEGVAIGAGLVKVTIQDVSRLMLAAMTKPAV
jgi:hypothetical protein